MELLFEDQYGILGLVATKTKNKKEKKWMDQEECLEELAFVLENVKYAITSLKRDYTDKKAS